jgi:lantibiotic biosynthesis protein
VAARTPVSYEWQSAAILRATTDPGRWELPPDLGLLDPDSVGTAREWLAGVWRREEIRAALSAASPALCRQINDLLLVDGARPRHLRRCVLSVASYLLRWQGRPTPFGAFAGTAPVTVGGTPGVSWGDEHQTVLRADADWISAITLRLEGCPALLERLPVVANDTGHVRGDWYVTPGRPADGDAMLMAPVEVSVRHSRPVAAALEAARGPVRYGRLRDRLATLFTAATVHQIEGLLSGLVAQQVLITSLWAPMTSMDALGHLCAELEAVDALAIPEICDLVRQLQMVRDELASPCRPATWSAGAGLVERMRALSGVAPVPLVIDTVLDCDVHIPQQVVREAEDAAGVLCRLTPQPFGYQQWRDYHRRFRARYGAGAAVPVMDLVSDSGLGLPAQYLGSALGQAPRHLIERDEKLLGLLQQALMEGRNEIVLTEPLIADLTGSREGQTIPAPRVEVAFQIHATSREALTRGAFRLLVTGVPRPGSSMAGRFAHLLPTDDQARLARGYEAAHPDAIAAQLSFSPRRRRNENVARTRQMLPYVISLGEHRTPHESLIPLADLAVTADAHRFHLVQLSTGRRIEPHVLHALEAGVQTPPLARFLAEITTARCAAYKPFDFGAAARLPYLPRVRYKRTVLAPARWLLTARDLPGRRASMPEWDAAFETWRTRLRVPERIAVTELDQRLPLDLAHPVQRLLLRSRLNGAHRLELRETPDPHELAWIGRVHEVLLPLTVKQPAGAEAPRPLRPVRAVVRDAGHLPGHSTILHAQIFGSPLRYDEILTAYLPDLINSLESPLLWWFRRHRELARPDADQHLALYVRLSEPDAYRQAAQRLHDWGGGLRRRRLLSHLTLATYEPQAGCYGHGQAMDAVHAAFAADSVAALAQINVATSGRTNAQALAAASAVNLVTTFSVPAEQGLRWLIDDLPQSHGPLDRALRDESLRLADPDGTLGGLRSLPGGQDVAATWDNRAAALTTYRESLAGQRDPSSVVRSLIHLHHVRALGVDPDLERVTNRLIRACAAHHIHAGRPQ